MIAHRDVVLYSHIKPSDQSYLARHSSDIKYLLSSVRGILVLFLDQGLQDLLHHIQVLPPTEPEKIRAAKRREKNRLQALSSELQSGRRIGAAIEAKLGASVRVLTALDLVDIFAEMTNVARLEKFLVGDDGNIKYDTPKFVEAVVRLRMIGSRIPVLRLDRDVLMSYRPQDFPRHSLESAIFQMLRHVADHHERTQVLATILSASYVTPPQDSRDVMQWARGYATRLNPALIMPTRNTLKRHAEGVENWEEELQDHFKLRTAISFFEKTWLWGAPTTAVISGALLYMSDAVVLNVPPFSNFTHEVMWIDDHLRYVLHRELGDFCKATEWSVYDSSKPLNVLSEGMQVVKHRTAQNFLDYTISTYLPSILWGSIFDFWLSEEAILKRRVDSLDTEGEKRRWAQMRRDGAPGVLARAIRQARVGHVVDLGALREDLLHAAGKRLKHFRSILGDLTFGRRQTLVSAWINDKLPKGYAALPATVDELLSSEPLGRVFQDILRDTCYYVNWVQEWPSVVSVIRAVRPGELRSDLEWLP